jgi:hypothetical protein
LEIHRDSDVFVCELVVDSHGAEERITRNAELLATYRSDNGWEVIAWAEEQQKVIEKGGQ